MKFYFLTDESEKSLAPFFSKRVLETVFGSAVIIGAILIAFWPRKPLFESIASGSEPIVFFLTAGATLVVYSYVNLCCGSGDMVRKGYYMIRYQIDKPTYEKEIDFYRYGLIEFLLHALLLMLPFLPMLALAAFSSAASTATFIMAALVLYITAVFCRMSGFLVYLLWGRTSNLSYFASRALMILFVFASILFAPAVNPLHLIYLLTQDPEGRGYPFAIYISVVLLATLALILANSALVRRNLNK